MTLAVLAGVFFAIRFLEERNTQTSAGRAIVNDGDTLTIANERIRLRGIDAPEFNQICQRDGADYPCGRMSRDALRGLVNGQSVTCEGHERDQYDRLLGRCMTNGKDIAEALVEAGWALAYGDYEGAESRARQAGNGVWAGDFERPRAWRARYGALGTEPPLGWYSRLRGFISNLFSSWR